MTIDSHIITPTVAIGGVGGSGTRLVARLMAKLGLYIGGDLNTAHDNLWFTLLFKRRSILAASDREVLQLFKLFCRRMSGVRPSAIDNASLTALVERPRLLHARDWLEDRRRAFCDRSDDSFLPMKWGWKEPNTHMVIDRLLAADPTLRYIHVVRDALYMSAGQNQNQLRLWGPILLDRDIEMTPRDSLSYWCAAQKRAIANSLIYPGRVRFVDFDDLCAKPRETAISLATFVGVEAPAEAIAAWTARVECRPRATPIATQAQFNEGDLEYAAACGYDLQRA